MNLNEFTEFVKAMKC